MEDQETKPELQFSLESYKQGQDGIAAQGTYKMGPFAILHLQWGSSLLLTQLTKLPVIRSVQRDRGKNL